MEGLLERLQQAYAKGAVRLLRRIHALMYFFEGKSVAETAELLKESEQAIHNYVKASCSNAWTVWWTNDHRSDHRS